MSECPFCGSDPYEYVNNGLGMEAVAITCCELGVECFSKDCRIEIQALADRIYSARATQWLMDQIIDEARKAADALEGDDTTPQVKE